MKSFLIQRNVTILKWLFFCVLGLFLMNSCSPKYYFREEDCISSTGEDCLKACIRMEYSNPTGREGFSKKWFNDSPDGFFKTFSKASGNMLLMEKKGGKLFLIWGWHPPQIVPGDSILPSYVMAPQGSWLDPDLCELFEGEGFHCTEIAIKQGKEIWIPKKK
ncbi:hypothetical protein JW887_03620 [Candidatus Dojkabacteria bacterium]|nr:hypothetical protein [Candidatus Dojkabacteria bacterium]